MRRCIVGVLAALLIAAGLIAVAPQAGAACLYGGPVLSKCDGPVQPDGTWQRCVGVAQWVPSGFGSHLVPVKHCDVMGSDQPARDLSFADPPIHID